MATVDDTLHPLRPVRTLVLAVLVASMTVILAGTVPTGAGAAARPRLSFGAARVGTKEAPLRLRVRAAHSVGLKLWVNGKSVEDAFEYRGRGIHVADLDADDGLVPGGNRLRVRAAQGGSSRTATKTVNVPRDALLADAGRDIGARVGGTIEVGTAPAGPAATPGLRHRWRIVKEPRGANATLDHRDRAQPLFHTTAPGTYVLQEEAQLPDDPSPSDDEMTVSDSPDDPPIGAPIDTLATSDGTISIGGQTYGGTTEPNGLSYVLLERTTRRVVESGHVRGDFGGIGFLIDLANQHSGDEDYVKYILVVSGGHGLVGADRATEAQLQRLVKAVGGNFVTADEFAALRHGQSYSIIGIPGAPADAATVRIPLLPDQGDSGALTGYLEKNHAVVIDGATAYDYVSAQHPAFDTQGPGSGNGRNIISVGDEHYEVSLQSDATAGLQVLMLDPTTMKPLADAALTTNSKNSGQNSALQGEAAKWIKLRLDEYKDPVVLVQTIGKPKAAGGSWEEVVGQLARLGANRQLVNYLNGENEYALVGRLGSEQPPAEASTAHDGPTAPPPARLEGILSQTRDGTFEPVVAGSPVPGAGPPVNLAFFKIAYQAPRSWPELAPGQPRAEAHGAEQYICKAAGFCKEENSCPDMRSCYWMEFGGSTNWQTVLDAVNEVPDPGTFGGAFAPVKHELFEEVKAVAEVRSYLELLKKPLDENKLEYFVNLKKIGESISKAVAPPPDHSSESWTLGLLGKIAALGGALQGPAAPFAKGLASVLGLASYLSQERGTPILADPITAQADALGESLLARMRLAKKVIDGFGPLLVSDYGKLMDTEEHIHGDWHIKADDSSALEIGAKQWFYESLLPVAYPYLIELNANNAREANCPEIGIGAEAWPNQPNTMQMLAPVGYDQNGNPIRAIFFFTRGILGGSSPPEKFADDLWRPTSYRNPGLGMEKLTFFTPTLFRGQVFHAVQGKYWCNVHFLPHLR